MVDRRMGISPDDWQKVNGHLLDGTDEARQKYLSIISELRQKYSHNQNAQLALDRFDPNSVLAQIYEEANEYLNHGGSTKSEEFKALGRKQSEYIKTHYPDVKLRS